jgi:predicted HTH transcriptional regulator
VFHRNIPERSSEKSSGKSSEKNSKDKWTAIKRNILITHKTHLGKSALKILEMTYYTQHVTISEMATKIKLSERAVEKNIQNLKEKGFLVRFGSERSGHWKVVVDTKSE